MRYQKHCRYNICHASISKGSIPELRSQQILGSYRGLHMADQIARSRLIESSYNILGYNGNGRSSRFQGRFQTSQARCAVGPPVLVSGKVPWLQHTRIRKVFNVGKTMTVDGDGFVHHDGGAISGVWVSTSFCGRTLFKRRCELPAGSR